ncbi:Na+/melibiose symporter-like transporter [Phenylobacterium haematophilum]|uniref:Na+/melibiose symporter-like transporter n=1 Tax=Phenylobacterium haematophilum TaxID=98513 RepID=A0A839ZXQ8_9CAUL|nr:MFS transporter [Phenylobacterium haematophilum]MBB3890509.1 Na+/melibiose symporter-like transporter [Phenylobacterium haematophilum]
MIAPVRLPAWRLAVFAALAIPLAGAGLPLAVYLPPYYAQELGLGLGAVGLIFMLSRVWDAATDPLVGVLSDRTRSRFGRRKPWIAAGAPLFTLSTAAIFAPGLFGVERPGAAWLSVWLAVFYVGWTMIQIPVSAWAGQLAAQYHERSRVQTYFQVATAGGLLLVLVLPAVLDQLGARAGLPADPGLKVAAMGGFILATFVPTLIAALALVKEPPAPPPSSVRSTLRRDLALAARDPLLRKVLTSDFAVTLGQLIRSSLFVFFVSAYMGRPDLAAGLFLLQFVFGVFAGPIWLRIGYRLGKHRAAIAGELVQVAINLALLFIVPSALPLLVGLTIAQGLAQGSGNLMLRSMVADIADKQRLESGEDRIGLLFSIFSLTGKAATAVAVGVALPLVGLLGFKPGAANSAEALLALKLVFALGPALAHLASAWLISGFSLDAASHADIRRQLDSRDAAAVPAE